MELNHVQDDTNYALHPEGHLQFNQCTHNWVINYFEAMRA